MGSPYLNSGESITMTTHRVGVDSIPYDVMLTTHRLTLIDSRYARFEPLMIAFEDILTVKSGAVSTGEPVILLSYTDGDGAAREMNLIFSQQPGEHRKHERDLWVKKLMESIIAEREEPPAPDECPAAEPEGLQPSVRRWVAPEGIALHTPFAAKETAQPEITIVPDDKGFLFERAALPEEPAEPQEDLYTDLTGETGPGENSSYPKPEPVGSAAESTGYEYGETDEDGEDEFIPAPAPDPDALHGFRTIVIPFVPVSEPVSSIPLPHGGTDESPHVPAETILAAVQSLIPKEPAIAEPDDVPEPEEPIGPESRPESLEVPVPAFVTTAPDEHMPGSGSSPVSVPEPVIIEPVVEMKHDKSPPTEPTRDESPVIQNSPDEVPDAPVNPPADRNEAPGPSSHSDKLPVQTHELDSPAGSGRGAGNRVPREPEDFGSGGQRGTITLLLVIMGVLALAGIIVLAVIFTPLTIGVSQGPVTVPAMTTPPVTTPAVITIPAEGAGFRVIYPGDYSGEVGNPGMMKMVSGSGDLFFPVRKNDGLVQATIRKQDNSGNILVVEVYNNGKMIYTRSVSTPRGSIDILIDARTGMIPGMTRSTAAVNQTGEGKLMDY